MTSCAHTRRGLMLALPGLCLLSAAKAHAQQAEHQTLGGLETDHTLVTYELDAWVDAWGRPTAKVMINGHGPFNFMVDTGSTTTVIANRHLERIGAPVIGMTVVHGTTGQAEMPIARLQHVETGAVRKNDLIVAVLSDRGLAREDGILGADVFVGRRLTFDIAGKSVRVEKSLRTIRDNRRSNLKLRNGMLAEISGQIGTVRARLMLDTGAQKCIVNPKLEAMLKRAYPRMLRFERARIIGVTGHELVGSLLALPEIDMGIVKVRDATAIGADAPIFRVWRLEDEPAMIIGVELLSRLSGFSIDYGSQYFDARVADLMATNRAMTG